MTTVLALPLVCSATVLAMSFLGVRPIVMACTMPVVVGSCWVLL